MEEVIQPDKKFLTKSLWIHLTSSAVLVLLLALIHLITYLADGDSTAFLILWMVEALPPPHRHVLPAEPEQDARHC